MYICENCKKEHNGIYGSGRFCSLKCAKSFSTKANRKNINEKVSKKLKNSGHQKVKKICPTCNSEFKVVWSKRQQIYCCRKCKKFTAEVIETIRQKMIGVNAGEKNPMFGKSPTNTKRINVFSEKHKGDRIIVVRSSYEKIFINELNNDASVKYFEYEPKKYRIEYFFENKKRTYQPDFLINDKDIIEIKNKWNVTLEETKIKQLAFENKFPHISYKIISW